jgi:hypothetical protein
MYGYGYVYLRSGLFVCLDWCMHAIDCIVLYFEIVKNKHLL